MRALSAAILMLVGISPASSEPMSKIFRPTSFICASGPDGMAFKVEENVLGRQRSYKVTYMQGQATLFVVSESTTRHLTRRIALIDLRAELRPTAQRMAREISFQMKLDADRYCNRRPSERAAARKELLANHEFNRSHADFVQ